MNTGAGPQFDYVIVGAGTAGCVLASRLSAVPGNRVLLIEAGPRDTNPWIDIPAGVSRLFSDTRVNWAYTSEGEPGLNGRKLYWPRGKVLGGTSAINGHVYMRGNPGDYDAWRDAGNRGWGWSDVLPYFRRSERFHRGEDPFHGACGELPVTGVEEPHPTSEDFVRSAVALGHARNEDFNGATQEGVGYLHYMIGDGRRASTARVFLRPVLGRPNLRVETGALVERVLFDGRVARGVRLRDARGAREIAAVREVILCGGAINTPQLLMLSGIGEADHLRTFGIDVRADLPGVGRNLQDHIYVHSLAAVDEASSLNRRIRGWRIAPEVLRYVFQRKGLLTSAAAQVGLFAKSSTQREYPDLQIQMRPFSMLIQDGRYTSEATPAITASCTLVRPHSRGEVRLRSARPGDTPSMVANYLTDARDIAPLVEGLRIVRDILHTRPFHDRFRGDRLPGPGVQSERDLVAYLRQYAQSMYHPVGTCRMGPGEGCVVDDTLRVHGVERLRVVDASVMPLIPSGNTNAPTIMVAEKAADIIVQGGRAGAAPSAAARHPSTSMELAT